MNVQTHLLRWLRPALRKYPSLKRSVVNLDEVLTRERHELAKTFPILITPQPRKMHVAITANCNLRCVGCRYGRDFMPGKSLSLPTVLTLLDDAKDAGFQTIRFYGGEPLLHKDLPAMVRTTCELGMTPFVTTNAILLAEKIDGLFAAGLRRATIGLYGDEHSYDAYVQRSGAFVRMEAGIKAVRERYGKQVQLQLNFLLSRRSCSREAVRAALRFAEQYETSVQIDLVHYSLPYFSEGPDRELQFISSDRPALEKIVQELLDFRSRRPDLYPEPVAGIRSIPDWALKGSDMRVPCNAYRMVWVGADGTVQLCYVTFNLGNLHEKRLREMMFSPSHSRAAKDAFALNCPNCHCQRFERIQTDKPSLRLYSA